MSTEAKFRDQLYNTDESGRRVGFFPKRPRGRFYNRRVAVSWVLLLIFFGLPWIKVNGDPLFLFNVLERKFILFGQVFWPQDFILVALLGVGLFVSVFLFTTVFGRIWCGWTCPQTIFLEMVYRRIEFWIEGDSAAQKRLDRQDWSWDKIKKRSLKQTIFVVIAFLVSNTVLAYVIGMDQVLSYVIEGPAEHLLLFGLVLANTAAFYLVFAWFREQACIYVCPYGRLQGVMLHKKTLVISYDHVRGEPRGKVKAKEKNPELGDCIDCRQCVAVCPTGIDIRHGTQLECVNCTACIDACDTIMDKVGRPRGLVRYASEEQIETGKPYKLDPLSYVYMGILAGIFVLFTVLLIRTGDLKVTMLRAPGQTYTMTPDGNVTNLYSVKVLNKDKDDMELSFRLHGKTGETRVLGAEALAVPGGEMADGNLIVELPADQLEGLSFDLEIEVLDGDRVVETLTTKFNGPMF